MKMCSSLRLQHIRGEVILITNCLPLARFSLRRSANLNSDNFAISIIDLKPVLKTVTKVLTANFYPGVWVRSRSPKKLIEDRGERQLQISTSTIYFSTDLDPTTTTNITCPIARSSNLTILSESRLFIFCK